jgi:serine/threonine protein kinase
MATVYAVVHAWHGRRAALKIAHGDALGSPLAAAMIEREGKLASRIDHPSVIDVFSTGTFDNRPYLVMEQLSGQTLGARLDAGPLSREEALEVLLELCEVLHAAHLAGVVHRDLKLDNVFLLARPGLGRPRLKLLDWGMATLVGRPDPLAGMIAGTLTYVAPEQIRGEAVTPASDVYALGVLTYELLLGGPPFSSPSDLELLQLHLSRTPPPPSARWPEIPPALDELLVGMLAKLPAARPALVEVAQAVRGYRRSSGSGTPVCSRWLCPPTLRRARGTEAGARSDLRSPNQSGQPTTPETTPEATPDVPPAATRESTTASLTGAVIESMLALLGARHRRLGRMLALAIAAASLGSLFG